MLTSCQVQSKETPRIEHKNIWMLVNWTWSAFEDFAVQWHDTFTAEGGTTGEKSDKKITSPYMTKWVFTDPPWCMFSLIAPGMNGLVSLARVLCRSQCAPLSWSSLRGRLIPLSLHRRSWRWGRWVSRLFKFDLFNDWHRSLADPDHHPEVHAGRLFRGLEYPGPDYLRHVDWCYFSCMQLICAAAAPFFDLVQA